jgi:hypothetical protein
MLRRHAPNGRDLLGKARTIGNGILVGKWERVARRQLAL